MFSCKYCVHGLTGLLCIRRNERNGLTLDSKMKADIGLNFLNFGTGCGAEVCGSPVLDSLDQELSHQGSVRSLLSSHRSRVGR